MTNIFFPSTLGSGKEAEVGPVVSCTGSGVSFRKKLLSSPMAQMFCVPPRADWKTKYLPSGVQVPQHSAGGLLNPANNGRRWLPSASTCQSALPLFEACTVKRRRLPSGDQRGQNGVPSTHTIFRESFPSILASYRQFDGNDSRKIVCVEGTPF